MIEPSSELQDRKNLEALLASQASMAETLHSILQELIKPDRKYVYGIQGLADLLHCSRLTAQHIKNSGKIDDATIQFERTVIFDAEKVMESLKVSRKKK